jgi:hypothetical protein
MCDFRSEGVDGQYILPVAFKKYIKAVSGF